MARDDEQIRSDVPPPRWRIIQPSSPQLEPLIDFSKPELWNERTQGIVDGFRLKLENFKLHICPTCSRFQSFDRSPRSQECSHCTTQKRKENISHFGVANDMDPAAKIEALYQGISKEDGAKVDSDYCNNLEHALYLSVGCRVKLPHFCVLMLGNVNKKRLAIERSLQWGSRHSPRNSLWRQYQAAQSTNLCACRI